MRPARTDATLAWLTASILLIFGGGFVLMLLFGILHSHSLTPDFSYLESVTMMTAYWLIAPKKDSK